MTECLSDETVQMFVHRTIPASDIQAVQEHLRECPDCLRVVADTARPDVPAASAGGPSGTGATDVLSSGVVVSRYLVGEVIGAGGVGIVYAAYDPQLDRKVALKFLWSTASASAGNQARLLGEAQAMAKLSHPNVVNVYDAGRFNDKIFIVMELVEGPTVQVWLAGGARPWREVLAAFLAAGRGLAAAHAAQVVHGDFKPGNVLVGADGRPRVTDFGLATGHRGPPGGGSGIAGTPAYMAPEQFLGKSVDARTDQFSFCVALYQALYGQRPFESVPRESGAAKGDVPLWLANVLARGLQARPEDRFASMTDLLDSIDQRLARDAARKRFARFTLAAAAIGLVSIIIWQWASHRQDAARHPVVVAAICGNGVVETGEECDDANRSSSDGCLSNCKFATCGDGWVRSGVEECDDGNQRDGDECSSHCLRCALGDARLSLPENGHCYSRYDRPQTWQDASTTCLSVGGHLITFNNAFERGAIHSNLIARSGAWYWIGFHDPSGKGNYEWATGEAAQALQLIWDVNISQPNGACVAIEKPVSSVAAKSCDLALGFICEKDTWITRSENNHAYRAFRQEKKWEDARNLCQRAGAHLVTISDTQEAAFVHSRFPGTQWAGAIKASNSAGFHAFEWITGEVFSPSLFGPDDPNVATLPACVVLGDDLWLYDRQCDGSDRGPYGVVCESD